MSRNVAIVGRPNVGKSRLFNRLAKRRVTIVHDQPGITRDVISFDVADGGYTLLDTGGLGLVGGESTAELTAASEQQVDFAIAAADLILFVVDGIEGLTALDTRIASMLRRSKKTVQVVINKADFGEEKIDFADIYRLGLGEPVQVSAEHGRGEADLRETIISHIGPPVPEDEDTADKTARDPLCVCFIGRPNVGKSSLSNRLLKSDRLIVSATAGTTRDAVELPFQFKARNNKLIDFTLIDTAGIKANTKLASPVEYFSRLRALDSIQKADVIYMVVDALEGITQQDKAIAGEAVKESKPIIVVVNKWDLVLEAFKDDDISTQMYKNERDYREKYEKALFERLFFTPGSPVIFVSAVSAFEIDRMLNSAVKINRLLDMKIPTARLNALIVKLTERMPPPAIGGRRFKIYYATQTGNRPFRFRIFCNREEKLPENYRRYLERGIVNEFGLEGCPMLFRLIGKEKHKDRGKHGPLRKSTKPPAGGAGADDDFGDGFETLED
ncbi:ribosome biogenesis GTPase Der [Synoicihabitans lomoniglobus]|uniref:GTPase Der n=1 Tax=Synoicihabitans lomoniglobus TaxID=2909285 RepID=A0AAF0I7N9_9BACT|nr:ribosome biogenesis GTPase Der [Opitutaceae bacterium LMO-M01]WED66886.1 ribosome biogenesis GTPase Der [Opitutaceae bacterium LMO-M01]